MNSITSRKNPIIRHAAALSLSASKRAEEGLFMAEGARLSQDAAKSGTGIFRLFYTKEAAVKYSSYLEPIKAACEEEYLIEPHVAEVISSTKNNQGVFCVCKINGSNGEIKGKILVLENIQDPNNLGNIFRTGEALGIETFMLSGNCCDIYSPKVLRASMGGVFRINAVHCQSIVEGVKALNKLGYICCAAVPSKEAELVTKIDLSEKVAVLIGNEGNGLTPEAVFACHKQITIPMNGRAESLNASTAAAIVMWEMCRI